METPLVVLCISSLLILSTQAVLTNIAHNCSRNSLFAPNSTYQANLNLVLSSLLENSRNEAGFYNSTAGQNTPEAVYGSFLCRGDLTPNNCEDCVRDASKSIIKSCPSQKTSIIWYDQCTLRYSNINFFSIMEVKPSMSGQNRENIEDPDHFIQFLKAKFESFVSRVVALYGASNTTRKFVTADSTFNKAKIYSFAQCSPDISAGDCGKCLREAIESLPSCCTGKIGGRVLFPSCSIRYEEYAFYATTSSSKSKGSLRTIIAIVVSVTFVVVAVVLSGLIYWFLKKKKGKKHFHFVDERNGSEVSTIEFLHFGLSTIEAATDHFLDNNQLGEGGFGVVYKGILPNGQTIAAKRLSKSSGQGVEEFKNEAESVAKLQHRNLVRLLGLCSEKEEKILVFEYMHNGSLDHHLFDAEKKGQLDWPRRYKIILGIARGLLYLHEDSRLRVIHRDLKASNVLLDENMIPKISDFGTARIFGADETLGNTNRIVGTYGYMSPEYINYGQISVKSDVFSFGVLILEIITGRKNSLSYESSCGEGLLGNAWRNWRSGTPLQIMDPALRDSCIEQEVIRCIDIGLLCVQEDMEDRPTMASVVVMLNSDSVSLQLPNQPAFTSCGKKQLSLTSST
ncbi:cysteine-rich receptor-like protein kinase 25 isoform X2 [Tripterygium wilfordii]|uniref:cysteine-rich receptor-like protein kinase 25 isoform X2 n=1 Tax=Tripterygium wilfordii TaxID=458696 RepID=UPI0018F8446D|nr:cysteine-rich receptor-like protein kinase 25 isoform X2 [Tripterygium wilfordii]